MPKKKLLWKFVLILAVVGGAIAFGYPPKDKINLGLDLRGGTHILMQVDTKMAIKYEMDLVQSRIGQRLKAGGLTYDSVVAIATATLEIHGTQPDRSAEVRDAIDGAIGQWTISDLGSGDWRLTMPLQRQAEIETGAVDITLNTIRNRIDGLGVSEPLVQKQGLEGKRILIQLPGLEDPERAKDIIGDEAVLEWKAMTYPPQFSANPCRSNWFPPQGPQEAVIAELGGQLPEDTELYKQEVALPDGGTTVRWWPLKQVSAVVGSDLRTANADLGQWGDPVVTFELKQDAAKRFGVATQENLGCVMAIVLGGHEIATKRVITAPTIEGVIRDRGEIRGGFSATDAEDLALKLRSGALPTDVTIIEERTVGPSLGRDSIRAGLVAGIAGFLGVLLFMVVYYKASGINAVVALALNVILVFGTLGALPFLFAGVSNLKATLTLPGIAGLILTVGMAVDANVLIFERIREELRLGKTVRSAVDQGFGKAFMTILDCNVTTVIAALVLGMYGTGPVRGFAVTLIIGLVASMFTAVFVSRQLFELVLLRKERVESLSI